MNKANIFLFSTVFYLAGTWFGVEVSANFILQQPVGFEFAYEKKVNMQGQIVSDPGKSGYQTTFYVLPSGAGKKVLVSTLSRQIFNYGDKVMVAGKLREPISDSSEHFDYGNYLKSRGVYGQISYAQAFILKHQKANPIIYYCLVAKRWVYRQIFKNLPLAQAALLISLLTGQKDFLSKQVLNAFTLSGTAHIVAVSGFILTLIMLGFEKLSPYFGKRIAYSGAACSAAVYLIMTAFAPGVVRAAMMSAMVIMAKTAGRKYSLLLALFLTAIVLVTFEPMIIKYDLGFLLSFGSILGIYFFSPALKRILSKIPEALGAREIIVTTLSAQLATIPITLYYFDQFSVIAPLTNLLILPIVPPLSIFGYACAIPLVGRLAGRLFIFPLNYMLAVVQNLAIWPGASSHFRISAGVVLVLYGTELFLLILFRKLKGEYE